MTGLAALAGGLQVRLLGDAGHIARAEVCLQRSRAALGPLLVGLEPAAALARVPRLFALCAAAQQVAAVTALEAALGWSAPAPVATARQRLVALERLREAALRLVRDWGLPWPLDGLRALLGQCQAGIAALAPVVAPGLRCSPPLPDLPALPASPAGDDWLAPRLASWQGVRLGHDLPAPLRSGDLVALLPALRAADSRALVAGEPRQTGPATAGEPAADAATRIAQRVRALHARLQADLAGEPLAPPTLPETGRGEGLGWADTARGVLLHRVVLDAGRVADWQLLAPTDWNFEARGVLARELSGVALDEALVEPLARDLVLSIDPCVGFTLERVGHA